MRLFNCDTQTINMTIVELPKTSWRIIGRRPSKLTVMMTLAGIVISAIAFGVLS